MTSGGFQSLRCSLDGVFAIDARSPHRFGRHTHAQFGVGVITAGAQRSASGRGPVQAEAGDVITVNPDEVHDGAPIGEQGRSWRMLYFEPAVVIAFAGELGDAIGRAPEFPAPVYRDAATAATFLRLFDAMTAVDGIDGAGLRRDSGIVTLLARLFDAADAAGPVRAVPAGIAQARACIDDDPAAPASLQRLADLAGLSRFQLLRAFAKATGLTPHAYQLQRRVDLARALMARGEPLAQAAAAAGFADQSHMTRVFVRKYGLSPRAYASMVAGVR